MDGEVLLLLLESSEAEVVFETDDVVFTTLEVVFTVVFVAATVVFVEAVGFMMDLEGVGGELEEGGEVEGRETGVGREGRG